MNSPLISIVMPVYNAEKYLKVAIDSVINQDYPNWELIVVDDCSRDKSRELLSKITHPQIHIYFNEENMHTAKTRNFAISKAKGDWIAMLDCDDAWEKDKLSKQVALINEINKPCLTFTGSAFMDSDGKRLDYILHAPHTINLKEVLKQNLISCSSVIVHKSLIDGGFIDNREIHEDFALWIKVLKKEKEAYGIDEPLLIYRLNVNGKSHNKIKSAMMNYRTYRVSGYSVVSSFNNMIHYVIRGLKKYRNLK